MCYEKTNAWPCSLCCHGWCQSTWVPLRGTKHGLLCVSAAEGSHLPVGATLWPKTNHCLTCEQGTKDCPCPSARKPALQCQSCFQAPQEHLEFSFAPSCHPPRSTSYPTHHPQENPLTSTEPELRPWEVSFHEVLERLGDPGKRISILKSPALPGGREGKDSDTSPAGASNTRDEAHFPVLPPTDVRKDSQGGVLPS